MEHIRIAIAEDNPFLLRSIQDKLSLFEDLKIKFDAPNGAELIEMMHHDHNLEVVLMDIEMPVMNGIDATAVVREKWPHIRVIMLTVFDDQTNIFNAIRAGANGYLLKDETPQRLHDAIVDIREGGAPMSSAIASKALQLLREPQLPDTPVAHDLTSREVEILEHLSTGLNYHQIADNLNISPSTVRKHIENIYRKLHVHNKMAAVRTATRKGIL